MSILRSIGGLFPGKSISLGQFAVTAMLTLAAVGGGWLLDLWLGIVGAYLPLLGVVAAVTWTSGLKPSLFSQMLGAALTLSIKTHIFSAVSKGDLQAVFVFLLAAKMIMFLLLSIRTNRDLQITSKHLEIIVQSTHDALWEWDLGTNYSWKDGKAMDGFDQAVGKTKGHLDWWLKRVHPSDVDAVWASLRRAIDGADSQWSHEYRLRRSNGSYAIVADHGFIVRNQLGTALRMFGGLADVSKQRAVEKSLAQSTARDTLTGLLNRESLLEHFHRLLEKQRYQNGGLLAALLIDVDCLRAINERFGQDTGNRLLVTVAARLMRCLREEDIAARLGGDEFMVLLDHIETSSEAVQVVKRIQHSLSAPFEIQGQFLHITVSAGVSFAESSSVEKTIAEAYLALRRAKTRGCAHFDLFEPLSNLNNQMTHEDGGELQRSLHDGSLQLHYQPIVSLQNGQTFGVEALLRWYHPKRGTIDPLEILHLAEETGLSRQLGQSILQQACLCLGRWKQSSQIPASLVMSLNLSRQELMRPTLLEEVQELLKTNYLGNNSLQIEVTESTIVEGDAPIRRKLEQLRESGLCIALDNFGKGCFSLGHLQQLPISTIKIDGLLTRQAGTDKSQMLDALIAMAEKLNLQVVAEQVETRSQLLHLEACGSSMAQGFVFSRPMSEGNVFELLTNHSSWNVPTRVSSSDLSVSRET